MSDERSKAWLLQQLIDEAVVSAAVRKMADSMQPVTCEKVLGPHQVRRCDFLSGKVCSHTYRNLT